jgi:RHS repeat-associated protein
MPGFGGGAFLVASEDGSDAYSFDASGRHLRTISRRTGKTIFSFAYNSNGLVIALSDNIGRRVTVDRDQSGRAISITSPSGQSTALGFDSFGNLSRLEGPDLKPSLFTFSQTGLLREIIGQNGDTSRVSYDSTGRLTAGENEDGGLMTVSLVPVPLGQAVTLTSAAGTPLSITANRLASGELFVTGSLAGIREERTIQPDGTIVTRMPNGSVSTILRRAEAIEEEPVPVYDATLSIPSNSGVRTKTLHTGVAVLRDVDGDIAVQTDTTVVNGRVKLTRYDRVTRTITTTSALGRKSSAWLDTLGRLVRDSIPGLGVASYGYDAGGRLATMSRGGHNLTVQYDSAGNLAARTVDGRTTYFRSDVNGRVTAKIAPNGDSVLTTFDAEGAVTSIQPTGRLAHTFTHTPSGFMASYTPPPLSTGTTPTLISYNLDGKPVRVVLPGQDSLILAYETSGALKSINAREGSYGFGYDAAGRLVSATSPFGEALTMEYAGPFRSRQVWSGSVAGDVAITYNNDFAPATETISGGNGIAYNYDADLMLRSAGALTISRRASDGLPDALTLNAVRTEQSYDTGARLINTATSLTSGTSLYSVTIGRDALARIVSRSETVLGVRSEWTYAYDTTARLRTVTRDGASVAAYDYDANGNRIRSTDQQGVRAATFDAQDRLLTNTGVSFGYEPSGFLKWKARGNDTTTYAYSSLGALIAVQLSTGINIEYKVDARGRRIGKMVNGTLVKGWLYGVGDEILAEVGPSVVGGVNNVASRFIYGNHRDIPEYMVRGGVTYRLVTDERGSVRLVVNAATGEVAQRIEYDAFGQVMLNTNPGFQPFGYASGLFDEQTGLVRFGARDYDAESGRWTSKDPIGFKGGTTNLYEYAFNDPINRTDRTGLDATTADQSVAIALAATIATFVMDRFLQTRSDITAATESLLRSLIVESRREEAEIRAAIKAVTGEPATDPQYQCMSEEIHDCKENGEGGSKNSRGDFTWDELVRMARELFGPRP